MTEPAKTTAVDDAGKEHSPLPWRSVYPLGSKQRCAAVQAGDHYVYLNVFKPDDMLETIRMHQATADFIAETVNGSQAKIADLEAQLRQERDAHSEELDKIRRIAAEQIGHARDKAFVAEQSANGLQAELKIAVEVEKHRKELIAQVAQLQATIEQLKAGEPR